ELEADIERVRREGRGHEPRAEPPEHGVEDDREGAERVDLPLERLRLFPERRRCPGAERIAVAAERQIVGAEAGGPEPRGQAVARQGCELAEGPHASPRAPPPGPEGDRARRAALLRVPRAPRPA